MSVKLDLIRLGEQLSEENNAAHDLWTWLPSYTVTAKHHGDHVSAHQPSNRDVMLEAALYLAHLRKAKALTSEDKEWFKRCTCGECHEDTKTRGASEGKV